MKATTVLCVAIAATAFAGPASAVYKCTTAKGVVYQDRPCREGNESDVRLTIPTGELAPRATTAPDDAIPTNHARSDDQTQTVKLLRKSSDGNSAKRAGQQKTEAGANDAGPRPKDAPVTLERSEPMTSEQARKAEPSAKYYSTESFSAGSQTPMQMNCESPTGERRTFYLSDGKLTSI